MPYVPPASSNGGTTTPTSVGATETFAVATKTQMLFKYPIKINGTLKVIGVLVVL